MLRKRRSSTSADPGKENAGQGSVAQRTAARKQTSGLIHASLMRVVSLSLPVAPGGANASTVHQLHGMVEAWSARLRGRGV